MNKPAGFEEYLGEYGPQLYDGYCGEPVMWGFKIVKHVGESLWSLLAKNGSMECSYPNWFLITRKLTRQEAIEKYGPVTHEEFGPRGGWKSVTFGTKTFCSQTVRPVEEED